MAQATSELLTVMTRNNTAYQLPTDKKQLVIPHLKGMIDPPATILLDPYTGELVF